MVGAVVVLLATLPGPSEPPVPIIEGGKSVQEVVSEGLTFYAEGDYQRAASWLALVALATPHLSAAADFALADMYERGLGVPQDVRRAYALYLHAGSSTADSYELQQLGRAAHARLTRELAADDERAATMLAMRGFRDGLVSQWLPAASGGVLEVTPDHLALQDGLTLHEQEWGQFSMVFERICDARPGAGRTRTARSPRGAVLGHVGRGCWLRADPHLAGLCRRSRRDRHRVRDPTARHTRSPGAVLPIHG